MSSDMRSTCWPVATPIDPTGGGVHSPPKLAAPQADDRRALISLEWGDPPKGAGWLGEPVRNVIDHMRPWLATVTHRRHLFPTPPCGMSPIEVS
jgi:hypothetical protein